MSEPNGSVVAGEDPSSINDDRSTAGVAGDLNNDRVDDFDDTTEIRLDFLEPPRAPRHHHLILASTSMWHHNRRCSATEFKACRAIYRGPEHQYR